MATSSTTAAQRYKKAMVEAMQSLVDADAVLVTFGHPGRDFMNWDDAVGFAGTSSTQDVATMGTNRSREEVLEQKVWISCFRKGGSDQEVVASDAAYALLGLLEHHVRAVDTTLGGVVRECFLTSHSADGETRADLLAAGRTIEIEATFTARVRVTGP